MMFMLLECEDERSQDDADDSTSSNVTDDA
jgi:hypothetical protein